MTEEQLYYSHRPLPAMMSYAQQAEDVILRRGLIGIKNGYYVDVGAGSPVDSSVTKYFYDKGWSGINIEPQADLHQALEHERSRDINLCLAIDTASGKKELTSFEGKWGLASTTPEVVTHHIKNGLKPVKHEVAVTTLNSVLEQNNVSSIDFLKIDVEGAEGRVLESIDLDVWNPSIIVIEATIPDSTEASWGWEDILLAHGYKLGIFDGLNRFYSRSDEILERIKIPANNFDRYMPYKWWVLMKREAQQSLIEKHGLGPEFLLNNT